MSFKQLFLQKLCFGQVLDRSLLGVHIKCKNNIWHAPRRRPSCPPPSLFNETACDEFNLPRLDEQFYHVKQAKWIDRKTKRNLGDWHLPCKTKLVHKEGRNFWTFVKVCEYRCRRNLVERHKFLDFERTRKKIRLLFEYFPLLNFSNPR